MGGSHFARLGAACGVALVLALLLTRIPSTCRFGESRGSREQQGAEAGGECRSSLLQYVLCIGSLRPARPPADARTPQLHPASTSELPPPPPAQSEVAARLARHQPLLPPDALRRGLSYVGGGERLAALSRKLLAGEAVSVVTLGGSVTQGVGAPGGRSYSHRLFEWVNTTFPVPPGAKQHTFTNRGIGGTTSSLFGLCAQAMVPEVRRPGTWSRR